MTSAQEITAKGNKVLIIDDGYDSVPSAKDLEIDDEAWSIFLDDLKVHPKLMDVMKVFPQYEELSSEALKLSSDFVSVLWGMRQDIEICANLFVRYEQSSRTDLAFLGGLESTLRKMGYEVISSGKTTEIDPRGVDLIFADLFLGSGQDEADIDRSIERLKELLVDRRHSPPLVILMSSSNLLENKKEKFRDDAELVGAGFRVYSKRNLAEEFFVNQVIERLFSHYEDSVCIANFLHKWDLGLQNSAKIFMKSVRRLDLSDYAKIRQVLLDHEEQPIGSFLLDIFDRVLQHEIEGDTNTIQAAAKVNNINSTNYPAPHISGTPDLQELVFKTMWQNAKRLKVKNTEGDIPVSFGDVILLKNITSNDTADHFHEKEVVVDSLEHAYIVLTPACDLVRAGANKRVLLMAGNVSNLTAKNWKYKSEGKANIPIFISEHAQRKQISWDLKNLLMPTIDELSRMLADDGSYCIAGRLRESYALEIQQKLLSDMGRVGVIAKLPATFTMNISVHYLNNENACVKLNTPKLASDKVSCYVGRNKEGDETVHLVFTEESIDELVSVIFHIDENSIHKNAASNFKLIKNNLSLFALALQKGINAPASNNQETLPFSLDCLGEDDTTTKLQFSYITRSSTEPKLSAKQAYGCGILMVLSEL